VRALLISTYELGRQPFGLASPSAWLRRAGVEVLAADLDVDQVAEADVRAADLIAFYVPMHTATRIALELLPAITALNPGAHICFYGLYAPANEEYLRTRGVGTILGGEFEHGLVALASRLSGAPERDHPGPRPERQAQPEPVVSLERLQFVPPDRAGLPELGRYAKLDLGNGELRIVGATEASRGCRHLCRHCPVVPVYGGRFRVVQREVVLDDIRAQVAAGAEHITFGDPDFFNGPGHAVAVVRQLHAEFPSLTYDVTIKIEHLRKQAHLLPLLRDTGCLFVTSAVEAVDERTLQVYEKNHTRQDFIDTVREFRRIGLHLNPTFVTFSPWTTLESYADLLALLADLELTGHVAPIQLAIRLLIPAGSRLLELPEVRGLIGGYDAAALYFPWQHPDPRVDEFYEAVRSIVADGTAAGQDRTATFGAIWRAAHQTLVAVGRDQVLAAAPPPTGRLRAGVPALTEPWYCCAEPTEGQLRPRTTTTSLI
jgi:radical SAM superfamily enzyme YgiQ (UPF0313 family)